MKYPSRTCEITNLPLGFSASETRVATTKVRVDGIAIELLQERILFPGTRLSCGQESCGCLT